MEDFSSNPNRLWIESRRTLKVLFYCPWRIKQTGLWLPNFQCQQDPVSFLFNGFFYYQQLSRDKENQWNFLDLLATPIVIFFKFKKTFAAAVCQRVQVKCSWMFRVCWWLGGRIIYSNSDKYCFYFFEQFAALVWVHLNKYKIFKKCRGTV